MNLKHIFENRFHLIYLLGISLILIIFGVVISLFWSGPNKFDLLISSACSEDYSPIKISRNEYFQPPVPHVANGYQNHFKLPKSSDIIVATTVANKPAGFDVTVDETEIFIKSDGSDDAKKGGFIQIKQLLRDYSKLAICEREFYIFVKVEKNSWKHQIEWIAGGFSLPYGSTTIKNNFRDETFLLTDCSQNVVYKFNDNKMSHFIGAGLGRGNNLGQLNTPADIKLSPYDGKYYVADDRNNRIQVFDNNGNFENMFGAAGKAGGDARVDLGYFANPLSIEFVGNQLVVSDAGNHRLQFRDHHGKWRAMGANGGDGTAGSGPGEFRGPYYMIRNSNDELLVVDRSNHRIQVLDRDGKYLREFGAKKSGEASKERGFLDYPHELDLDSEGRVFVTDTNNDRVNVYNEDGSFINDIYFPGFKLPKVVATSKVDERSIYLAFVGQNRVVMKLKLDETVFDKTTTSAAIPTTEKEISVALAKPEAKVEVSLSQKRLNLGSTVFKQRCASCHTSENKEIPQLGDVKNWTKRAEKGIEPLFHSTFKGKGLMPVRAGCEECSDEELKSAVEFILSKAINNSGSTVKPQTGLIIRQQWLSTSNRNVQGLGIAVDKDGKLRILAAEGYSASGRLFDESLDQKMQFSTKSPKYSVNALTADALITKNGLFVFTVYRNSSVSVFGKDGKLIRSFGSFGTEQDQMNYPLGLIELENGNILIADSRNGRLQEYTINGEWVRSIGREHLKFPYDLKLHQGKLYVSDRDSGRIVIFSKDGEYISEFSMIKMPDGSAIKLKGNQGIDFDKQGNLFILNSGTKQLIVVDPEGNGLAARTHNTFGWIRQIEVLPDDSFIVSILTEDASKKPGELPGGIIHFEPVELR